MKYFILTSTLFFFSFLNLNAQDIELPSGISVNLKDKEIKVPIQVINKSGQLEFIVTIGSEKDYESVFSTEVQATDIHMAMTMIDLSDNPKHKTEPKDSALLELFIQFSNQDKQPISHYLQWAPDKPLNKNLYYFNGSFFFNREGKKFYAAQSALNIVAAYPAKEMIIGPTFKVENPYADGEEVLYPNEKNLPSINTKGLLIISKAKSKK